MGFEYALVHIKYTIPPAIVLTLLYRPLFTKLDVYKVGFLITIAVVSTIPWDSYLIRNRIWSYPSHVIIGPTLFDIPLEEVFFFAIQTYNTSLLYLILSKPTYQPVYLRVERPASHPLGSVNPQWRFYKLFGQCAFLSMIGAGYRMLSNDAEGTYTGLILVWAVPFLLLLWSLAYQFILGLPISNTVIPIAIPTIYLWIVDTLALRRGTWVINPGTKFGIHLWDGLEIEEALFFLITNTLIVFGQVAFDNALAIIHACPTLFPDTPNLPSPKTLIQALLTPASTYDQSRLTALQDAVHRLKRKSRSFYLASSTFQDPLRTDLLLLYSFCRVADDLIDDAPSPTSAHQHLTNLQTFLSLAYAPKDDIPKGHLPNHSSSSSLKSFIHTTFPPSTHSALLHLPTPKLSRAPLDALLQGFETDLHFPTTHPIASESDLELYAQRVAGTVAHLCIELMLHAHPPRTHTHTHTHSPAEKAALLDAGARMGCALQYINVARDINVDARLGRVYIPTEWLRDAGLAGGDVLREPGSKAVRGLRGRLLEKAFGEYEGAKGAMGGLPGEARGPIRVAVESYVEIGRVLREGGGGEGGEGRATVGRGRRVRVAWGALWG